jgi:hypothetical protein
MRLTKCCERKPSIAGVRDVQFKEELMIAMGLNTEEEGSPMAFFRRGYKVCLHDRWYTQEGDQHANIRWRY